MENYSFNSSSYPDSHDSSPRSLDLDSHSQAQPGPWDAPPDHTKPKFLVSYGGKIQPRPTDNSLSYVGGDTKILSVDRSIRFSSLLSKLSALSSFEDDISFLSFKYQLPGEDLDALISVTNDDDLEHMFHEYDRLFRSSPKPARMRLFLFPSQNKKIISNNSNTAATKSNFNTSDSNLTTSSCGSDGGGKSERDRFVEALNSGPVPAKSPPSPPRAVEENVDFLFGLEKEAPPLPQSFPPPPPPAVVRVPDLDPDSDLRAHLRRLHVREENLVGGYSAVGGGGMGEFYMQRPPVERSLPVTSPPGYWPEKHVIGGGGFQPPVGVTPENQPMYVISAQGGVFHAPPGMRPATGPAGQGYYMQRVGVPSGPHEVYREQAVYNVVPPPTIISTAGAAGGISSGPAQMAYDSAMGRQVYYPAPGGIPAHAIPTGPTPPPGSSKPSQGSV